MKIVLKKLPLKKKTYEVKASVKNMRKTYKLQLVFAKNNDIESMDGVEVIESFLDSIIEAKKYITDVLGLTAKQSDALDDLEQQDLLAIANSLTTQLMGIKPDATDGEKK